MKRDSTKDVAANVPIEISRDEQVELAIIVVIEESGRCRPAPRAHACFRGDIGEGSIAVVPVEDVAAVIGHVQIGEAIAVVVTGGHSHSVIVARVRKPRGLGEEKAKGWRLQGH